MIEITKGCTDSSDVRSKRADFFHDIQYAYGILEDSNKNYYDETLFDSNLENIEDLEEEEPTRKKEIGLKFVSHINKLRKGNVFSNEFDSEYLIVTNTRIILAISQNQVERIKADNSLDTVSSFAVSLDRITSLLWYKLGRGFGNNSFPSSVDSILQARLVLSADIARKADQIYSCTKKEFDAGLIDEQKLAFRVIALREKPILPEELKGDDIEDIMDFSPEVIRRYEIEAESNSKALKEKDELIEAMRNERKTLVAEKDATINSQAAQIEEKNTALAQKDNDLAERDNIIKSQEEENRALQEKLNAFEKKENEKKTRKEKRKKWLGLVWSILWKLLFVAAIVIIAVLICSKIDEKATTKVGFIFGIIGTAASVYAVYKNDKDKYFPSDKKS